MAAPLDLGTVASVGAALGVYCALTRMAVSARRSKLRDTRARVADLVGSEASQHYPEWLVKPPWSPVAVVLFSAAAVAVAAAVRGGVLEGAPDLDAVKDEMVMGSPAWWINAVLLVHLVMVLFHMAATYGRWVFMSYTVTSWNMITLHALAGFLAPWEPRMALLARLLRFPMLLFNASTFFVWWAILFPLGMVFLQGKARAGFRDMQVRYGLINVHFLNLPLAAAQALLLREAQPFGHLDLWLGFVAAFTYLAFYLTMLEPNGIHFYIILSPRTPLCVLVYTTMAALYVGTWLAANSLASSLPPGALPQLLSRAQSVVAQVVR